MKSYELNRLARATREQHCLPAHHEQQQRQVSPLLRRQVVPSVAGVGSAETDQIVAPALAALVKLRDHEAPKRARPRRLPDYLGLGVRGNHFHERQIGRLHAPLKLVCRRKRALRLRRGRRTDQHRGGDR